MSVKMLERIQAIINKAESTEHAEEAKIFMEKAQELLAKYSLSEYDLKAAGEFGTVKDHVVTLAVIVNEPHANRKQLLLSRVAKANNLKVVTGYVRDKKSCPIDREEYWTKTIPRVVSTDTSRSQKYRNIYLTGFSKDVDATLLLYTSFLVQIARDIKNTEIPSYENKATYKSHFIYGFAVEVGNRLSSKKKNTEAELVEEYKSAGGNLLPVLVDRREQVVKEYERVWGGNLRTSRGGYTSASTSGYSAGRSAGQRADIGNKRIGGLASLGRGN